MIRLEVGILTWAMLILILYVRMQASNRFQ